MAIELTPLETFLESIGSIITWAFGIVGDVLTLIVDEPVLLFAVGLGLALFVLRAVRRMVKMR